MKTYSNLYETCLDRDFIKKMILEAAKGKKDRVDVRRVLEKVDHYVDYQVFRLDYITKAGEHKGRALDFMGFRFWRDRTTLRKSLMLRICRKAKRIGRKPRPTYYDAAAMLSYMGWIKNSSTYKMYEQRLKPYINVKQMKQIVSKKNKGRSGSKC